VPAQAGVEHLAQRVAVVHRHQLGAERLVGGVDRQRQAHRRTVHGHPLDPGDPADGRHADVRVRDADVREALAGSEHRVEVHERLAHSHEHGVVDGLLAAEMERLVQDLGRRQVAPEPHPPGGTEGARERAARLARHAQRAPSVAISHQHGLHRSAIARLEERLFGAIRRERLAHRPQRRERHLLLQAIAQLQRHVRHHLVGAGAARRPLPDLLGSEAGLAADGETLLELHEVHHRRVARSLPCDSASSLPTQEPRHAARPSGSWPTAA
jgi:hypothetical protein